MMKKMLDAFADRAESLCLTAFLELFEIFHRRQSIAIVCEPWFASARSVIHTPAHQIALSLLEMIGVDLIPHASSQTWTFRIDTRAGDALEGTISMSFFSPMDQPGTGAPGGRSKQLCSDQLFLEIIKSPRPDLLASEK
jgi:hypothetical protein